MPSHKLRAAVTFFFILMTYFVGGPCRTRVTQMQERLQSLRTKTLTLCPYFLTVFRMLLGRKSE
jgi:hypothetical protein